MNTSKYSSFLEAIYYSKPLWAELPAQYQLFLYSILGIFSFVSTFLLYIELLHRTPLHVYIGLFFLFFICALLIQGVGHLFFRFSKILTLIASIFILYFSILAGIFMVLFFHQLFFPLP